MTDELIDQVRAADPLPAGSHAPRFDAVYATFEGTRRDRGRRRDLRVLLAPVVSTAVAVGVAITAVTVLRADRQHTSTYGHQVSQDARDGQRRPLIPAGGMPGFVTVWGAALNSSGAGVISVQQCRGCRPDGSETRHASFTEYLFTTRDGGERWARSQTHYYIYGPTMTAQRGWGTQAQLLSRAQAGDAAAYEPGVTESRYAVTDDDGRSWTPAQDNGGLRSTVAVTDGEAWAVDEGAATGETIVHSPLHGQTLTPTASQPAIRGAYDARVVGAGAGMAYVVNANVPGQAFLTRDGGRSWQRMAAPPCAGRFASASLDAAIGRTVWLTCAGGVASTPRLLRSLDAGRSWQRLPFDWGPTGPQQLTAATAHVVWAIDSDQRLLRSTDAGASWQPVWSATDPHVSPLSQPLTALTDSPLPILSVQSATSASIVTLLNRGTTRHTSKLTNLVVYRTTDGGDSWQPYPVGLSSR